MPRTARRSRTALRQEGIIPTLKHFPGHGSAGGDTHLGVVDVTDFYDREKELLPYRLLFVRGYTDPLLTAHTVNRVLDETGVPMTLSRAVLTDLLRDEMGFDGVIDSDDMLMGAIVEEYGLAEASVAAVVAGVDVVLLSNNQGEAHDRQSVYRVRNALVAAVSDGTLSRERINQSVDRILALKERYGIGERSQESN